MRAQPIDNSLPNRSHPSRAFSLVAFLLLTTALTVTGCVVNRSTADAPRTPATLDDSWTRKYPPAAGPIAIDRRHPDWTTFIWLSTNHQLCIATVGPAHGGGDGLTCAAAPSVLRTGGPPALASKPLPQVTPYESSKTLLIGTVRGPVATVDVTLFSATVTSRVIMLDGKEDRLIGAYAVWVPARGHDEVGWSDITEVAARDNQGRTVDRIT